VETNEQKNRGCRDEQVAQEPALLYERRGTHGGFPRRQLREEIIAGEYRPLGPELMVGAILLAGKRDRFLQLAFDGIAAGEQLGDVLVGDLALELRVRHGL